MPTTRGTARKKTPEDLLKFLRSMTPKQVKATTIDAIAAEMGVCRRTVFNWLSKDLKHRLDGIR